MKIVEFTVEFSVRKAGEQKAYDDQYASWLVNDMKVAKFVEEPKEPAPTKLPTKEAKAVTTTKEEKQTVKRQTKDAKN